MQLDLERRYFARPQRQALLEPINRRSRPGSLSVEFPHRGLQISALQIPSPARGIHFVQNDEQGRVLLGGGQVELYHGGSQQKGLALEKVWSGTSVRPVRTAYADSGRLRTRRPSRTDTDTWRSLPPPRGSGCRLFPLARNSSVQRVSVVGSRSTCRTRSGMLSIEPRMRSHILIGLTSASSRGRPFQPAVKEANLLAPQLERANVEVVALLGQQHSFRSLAADRRPEWRLRERSGPASRKPRKPAP